VDRSFSFAADIRKRRAPPSLVAKTDRRIDARGSKRR
jgi:hypothetical protein